MKTIRNHSRMLGSIILLVSLLAGTVLLAAPSAKELQSLASRAYERHNYKQAIEYANTLLKSEPKGDALRAAQRVKAMAMCMYKRTDGVTYAKKIMGEHAPFKIDAALWQAVGYDRQNRYDRKGAYEGYFKAATLYERAKKLNASADSWLQAAQMLASYYGIQPREMLSTAQHAAIPDKLVDWPGDWSNRQKINLQAVLKICEHIAEMKVDDVRKAKALFFGASKACQQGQWDRVELGIAMYRRCVKEFAKQPQAPSAQYEIGQALHRFSKFVQAIKEYQLVFRNFPKSNMVNAAHSRIAEIKNPQLNLFIVKAFGPREKPQIFWRSRNIKTVHLEARPVDLVKAVEKISRPQHMLSSIIAQAKDSEIAAAWKFETPDEAKHISRQNAPNQQKQTTTPIGFPLKKLGAFLVTATGANPDGKKASSHCLVVISKIAAVAKTDADQTVMFVADSSSGASIGDASAAVARYWGRNHVTDHASGKTNDAGLINLDKLAKRSYCTWIAAVRKGDNQAICTAGNYSWSWWGYSHTYKVYGFTERPVYRPGQTVHFKQTIRKNNNGKYTNMPNTKVGVVVRDTKGVTIYSKDHVTDEFGSVEGEFKLKEEPPLGVYTIQVNIAGGSYPHYYCPGNKFRVEEYKKPEFKVNVTAARPDYRVGDEMKIKIAAKYYYGQPVAGAEVKYEIRKQDYRHRFQWPRPWRWYYDSVYHGYGGPYHYGRYRRYHRPW